jgi:membrane-bound lytic murein transglycosylase MltF
MKFTNDNNTEVVLNIAHITRIEKIAKGFLVVSFDSEVVLLNDTNSEKLFDYLAAKAAKDILGVQNLDTMQSKINDMLANLKLTKHE